MGGRSKMNLKEIVWKAGHKKLIVINQWRLQEILVGAISKGGITVTEEEYRVLKLFVMKYLPGFYLRINPHGILLPPGLVRVKLVEKPSTTPKYEGTDLEKRFEGILNDLGFKEGEDYKRQFRVLGNRSLDFAFPRLKVAFEPGAAFYHTPQGRGKPWNPFGLSPEKVYNPPLKKDIEKNEMLKEEGWVIGWLNEKFVENIPRVKVWIRRLIEYAQGRGSLPSSDEYFEEYDVIHPRSKLPHKNGKKESRYTCPFCESTNTKIYGTSCVCYNCFEMFSAEKAKRIE